MAPEALVKLAPPPTKLTKLEPAESFQVALLVAEPPLPVRSEPACQLTVPLLTRARPAEVVVVRARDHQGVSGYDRRETEGNEQITAAPGQRSDCVGAGWDSEHRESSQRRPETKGWNPRQRRTEASPRHASR